MNVSSVIETVQPAARPIGEFLGDGERRALAGPGLDDGHPADPAAAALGRLGPAAGAGGAAGGERSGLIARPAPGCIGCGRGGRTSLHTAHRTRAKKR